MDAYVELKCAAPRTEYSHDFLQNMLNAMAVSYHKYGRVKDAYPHKVDALKSLRERINKYIATGNTEYLIDVANFAMIEFMHPHLPDAAYVATDAAGSPGRVSAFTGRATQATNSDIGADAAGVL